MVCIARIGLVGGMKPSFGLQKVIHTILIWMTYESRRNTLVKHIIRENLKENRVAIQRVKIQLMCGTYQMLKQIMSKKLIILANSL